MIAEGQIILPERGVVTYRVERWSVPDRATTDMVTLTVTSGRQAGEELARFAVRRGRWFFEVEREARRRAFGVTQ